MLGNEDRLGFKASVRIPLIALFALLATIALSARKAKADPFDVFTHGNDSFERQAEHADDDSDDDSGDDSDDDQPPRHAPTLKINAAVDPNAAARAEFESQPRHNLPMYVVKTEWTDQDEAKWGHFVAQLGRARAEHKCQDIKSCMRNPQINPYAAQDPQSLILYSDCAEFPYLLRTYFAYHNGLPFSHVLDIKMNTVAYASAQDQDAILHTTRLDNDPYGNVITVRGGANVSSRPGQEPNFISYLIHVFDDISTRSFRVGPLTPGYDLSDVYPVTLDRNGIGPGTVVHTTGHAMVVWDVDVQGVVHVIDGHPDGSMQYKIIEGATLERSRPDQGLGFFKYRPLRLVGAQLNANGAYYGGHVVSETDAQLFADGKYSLDQWFGPGSNIAPGSKVKPDQWKSAYPKGAFFQVLAEQLRDKTAIIQADDEVGTLMQSLCDQIQLRFYDIDEAIKHHVVGMAHPDSLPQDVFGEEDAAIWGPYSTSGRDGRLKASVHDIVSLAIDQFRVAKKGTTQVHFAGSAEEFVANLSQRVATLDKACSVQYNNSTGKNVSLSYLQVLRRLNRLSFDPYLCPEKRWGASGTELASCQDSDAANAWYNAEGFMMNTVDKNNSNGVPVIRSDRPITLQMLRDKNLIDTPDTNPVDLGTAKPPMMDLPVIFTSPEFLKALKE